VLCLEGIKVIDDRAGKVAMAHALARIVMSEFDRALPYFGFVARNPGASELFCHVFAMERQQHAEQSQALLTKAFALAFSHEATLKRTKKGAPKPGPADKRSDSPPCAAPQAQQAPPPPYPSKPEASDWATSRPAEVVSRPAPAPAPAPAPVPTRSAPAPQQQQQQQQRAAANANHAEDDDDDDEDDTAVLATAAWYHATMPRDDAIELLSAAPEGSFVVRDSQTQKGNFALTMRAAAQMHHFIIRSVPEGFALGNAELRQPSHPSLAALVRHYTRERGCLPAKLYVASVNAGFGAGDDRGARSFIDPAYQNLKDLRGAM
jgi:hypothetical protein